MKLRLFVLLSLFSFILPTTVRAADPTYASAVVFTSSNVLSSPNAIGAPDNLFADFRDADASFSVDMGTDVLGDITITYRIFDSGAVARVELISADNIELQTTNTILSLNDDTFTISYSGSITYRYITITATEEENWSVDAVASEGLNATPTEETAEPPTVEETTGMLIKADGNAAIYVLGSDGKRHAFPSEAVFHSWFENFDDVTTVDATTLASYRLGANVTVRPGTYLVKLTTDPKTYAVESDDTLRWITSESIAIALYGANWADRVLDLSDTLWPSYTVGANVITGVHPDGTIIEDVLTHWYIENGNRFEISSADFADLQFDDTFSIQNAQAYLDLYVDGGNLELTNEVQYPF